MNPTHLAAFRAVAAAGGFVKAAECLGVSQPAVSAQVRELERDVKAKLFDRTPRGARLTAAGDLLLQYAERLAALEADARDALADLSAVRRGRLAVGASTTVGVYLLPGVLGRFREAHPDVRLEPFVGNTDAVQRRLLDGTLDLGLTEGDAPADADGLTVRVFARDELVVIAPPTHPLAKKRRPAAADLNGLPLIVREPGSGTRAVVEHALAAAKVTPGDLLTLGHTEAIKRAVAAGLGISVLSELAVRQESADGRLAVLRPAGLRLRRPLHLLTVAGRSPSPAAAAFVALLGGGST